MPKQKKSQKSSPKTFKMEKNVIAKSKDDKKELKVKEEKDQSKDLLKHDKTLDTKGIGSPSSNHNHPE